MLMLRVTICVPIYRVENYIERCARSLFEQTYDNIEYIFVNDSSPDKSVDVLRKVLLDYPSRKPHVRVINHEQNKGLAAARNTGVRASTGDFILHVDSDDWISKDAIDKIVCKQKEKNADIVEIGTCVYTTYGTKEVRYIPSCDNKIEHIKGILTDKIMHGVVFRFVRSSLYKDFNLSNIEGANNAEDLYIVPQLIWYSKVIDKIDEPLYYYYNVNNNSYTASFNEDTYCQISKNINGLKIFFKDKNINLYKTLDRCELKFLTGSMARLARVGGNKALFEIMKDKISTIDKKYYKSISIPYRPFLYINNYILLRFYAVFSAFIKHFIKKHLTFISKLC